MPAFPSSRTKPYNSRLYSSNANRKVKIRRTITATQRNFTASLIDPLTAAGATVGGSTYTDRVCCTVQPSYTMIAADDGSQPLLGPILGGHPMPMAEAARPKL